MNGLAQPRVGNSVLYDVLLIVTYNLSIGSALYKTAESLSEYLVKLYGAQVPVSVFQRYFLPR